MAVQNTQMNGDKSADIALAGSFAVLTSHRNLRLSVLIRRSLHMFFIAAAAFLWSAANAQGTAYPE
jgi:hypothetical protein